MGVVMGMHTWGAKGILLGPMLTTMLTIAYDLRTQQHDFDAVGLPYQRPIMSYSQDMLGCLDDKLTTLP